MAHKQIGKWEKYGKRYCRDWEGEAGLKDWVRRVPGDQSKAACRYCICEIRAHHSDLVAHSKTKKHKKHVALLSQPSANVEKHPFEFDIRHSLQLEKQVSFEAEQDKLDELRHAEMDESINVCALKLAAHIACHMSIFTVDHLGCIIGGIAEKDISLHRTKCSTIIRDIIGPTVHKELLRDIGNGYYSLIIDESSDVSSQKQLCLMVRYFSNKLKCIVSSFAGIITFTASDSDFITEALLLFLNENKLNIKKCVGIAADGLSANICDHKNSLLKKFYELNPCGVFIKCICHSLYLCLSRAIDVLPLNLEYMISQTYLWFSQSTFHQKQYAELYAAISVGENALKVLQVTDTRWLSISPCINRILSQYDTLKLHFQSVKDNEKDYSADLLYQMYSEPVNRLYLVFLQPLVQEANRISKLFLLETVNPVKLITELVMLYKTLLQKIVKPSAFPTWSSIMNYDMRSKRNYLPPSEVNLGQVFLSELAEAKLPSQIGDAIQLKCRDCIFELVNQIKLRLPPNVQHLESLGALNPSVVLSPLRPTFSTLSFLSLYRGDHSKLEQQWRNLDTVSWTNTEDGQIEQFWVEVLKHTDEVGDKDFVELGLFVLTLLTLPFSNAAVECTVSQMNLIKHKLKNRLQDSLLENILRIRAYMHRNKICCNQFQPSKEMISLFSSEFYAVANSRDAIEGYNDIF
ncbi:coenzyme Q-binding protein COQ10 homolog B, mitochondrial isoform X1 [Rhineura floridana]|uniref:coenzyme Q-binding protein COQ10 homolog B, mitochondrial isoform X1 n=2 Tax=Rhineura floridana TaxID=261503 RepID=UPI002AC8803D|nr:coenzyme Q-binding protein COQ10 homolog B, mitochondrial isoform X1 [Rhineura floridana]XP_061464101.1 coenzyme Q-binding protein COQ10 homolog B, mitochondrial isoform X1 [Rhineura floridana]XP_061464102.1 coenzyme Q-binding protein COQ10 homolog B, mitochondrial isoform X1 [Rhineura floridana]XP_061464103.1 coenzyme Q-binding protein COQ10 homolog B, mitochondrial isoform X1 [Rhineura floridana]XP_061464104.1 coenzyme Q-binding protein COQ10 homolog B, mitochondrial isoform X1 [Rhineura f